MTLYTFYKDQAPVKVQQKVEDFSAPPDYLYTDLDDNFRVYYPAGEWSKQMATKVRGRCYFGRVYLVKRDAQHGFCEFEIHSL